MRYALLIYNSPEPLAGLVFTVLLSTVVMAQAQKPTTGYAPVNGLKGSPIETEYKKLSPTPTEFALSGLHFGLRHAADEVGLHNSGGRRPRRTLGSRPFVGCASDGFPCRSKSKTRMLTDRLEVILHIEGTRRKYHTVILDIGPSDTPDPVITIGFPADF
jgi:hypothetical protein